jgi:hypothetical protein
MKQPTRILALLLLLLIVALLWWRSSTPQQELASTPPLQPNTATPTTVNAALGKAIAPAVNTLSNPYWTDGEHRSLMLPFVSSGKFTQMDIPLPGGQAARADVLQALSLNAARELLIVPVAVGVLLPDGGYHAFLTYRQYGKGAEVSLLAEAREALPRGWVFLASVDGFVTPKAVQWKQCRQYPFPGEPICSIGELLAARYPGVEEELLLDCDPLNGPEGRDCSSAHFLEGILQAGGGAYFDGVAFQAADGFTIFDFPWGSAYQYGDFNWGSDWLKSGPALSAKVNFIRDVLDAYGVSGKRLVNTRSAILFPFAPTGSAPSLVSITASQNPAPSTGTITFTVTVSDPQGGGTIERIYFGFANCSAATGEAYASNFERNLANYFGAMMYAQWNSYGAAKYNTGAACSGNSGDGVPWNYGAPLDNAPGTATLSGMSKVVSGDNATFYLTVELSGFAPGTYHTYYMVANNTLTHDEDPTNPYYTLEGAAAGQAGNIALFDDPLIAREQFIDRWMASPFHALTLLEPRLVEVGYGDYHEARTGGCLDAARGVDFFSPVAWPVYWPAQNGLMPLSLYPGNATPDPLASCPGYATPTGPPLLLMLGDGTGSPAVTAFSFSGPEGGLDACLFTETSYTNPDPDQQAAGRNILDIRDAIVLIPRQPLIPGSSYTLSITADGQAYTWSFTVTGGGVAGR